MYQLSRTQPTTSAQKQNYSKFFYLRLAVGLIAILALIVEGITDYFSLFKTMSEFTNRYGFSEWIPATASLMLVFSLTLGFYALGSFVARSIFEDGFNFRGGIKEMNHFLMAAILCLCLIGTSIYTLSTEGAQMVAGEYFSEKPVTKDTEKFLSSGTQDIEELKAKDIEAIEKRYNGSIAATEKAGKKALEVQRKRHWEKSKTERMEADLANKLANLEAEKAKEIKSVNELRNGQIKSRTEITQTEHVNTVEENKKSVRKAEERNARNRNGGYYIAFFCLPLTSVCLALKAWMDVKCGIKLEVTISKSDFSQNPFGAFLFALKDGFGGRLNNAAVKLHQTLAPRERLTFQDKDKSDEGGEWETNRQVGFNRTPERGQRMMGATHNLDFDEDFREKKN